MVKWYNKIHLRALFWVFFLLNICVILLAGFAETVQIRVKIRSSWLFDQVKNHNKNIIFNEIPSHRSWTLRLWMWPLIKHPPPPRLPLAHQARNGHLSVKTTVRLSICDQRPYLQMQSSWSMIRNFSNDNIFIVIFTSSGSNHDEQIWSLIGPASTNSANRKKQIFRYEGNQ